jgi:PadR family transcriptional regulator PadR
MTTRDPQQSGIEKWQVQLRKGAAELAVLGALSHGPSYGLAILESISRAGRIDISEGAIYPLLKRLEADGKLTSRWVEDEGASHPRKYYALTDRGRQAVTAMRREWLAFHQAMMILLDGSATGEADVG